jgi:hypothetical protein
MGDWLFHLDVIPHNCGGLRYEKQYKEEQSPHSHNLIITVELPFTGGTP